MFKVIGAVVVYGFALVGAAMTMQAIRKRMHND